MINKILCVIPKYDYGDSSRGFGFEYETFYKFFESNNYQVEIFDFLDEFKKYGKEKMNKRLIKKVADYMPDLVFFVPFTDQFIISDLKQIKKLKVKTLAWMCDDKWRFEKYSKNICWGFDNIVTTDPDSIKKYKEIGYKGAILSQWACNSDIYKNKKIKKDIDVSFIGQVNPWRSYVVEQLEKNGINIECYGYGWKNNRLTQSEMINIYNRSKICLNFSNSVQYNLKYLLRINFNVDKKMDLAHKIINMFPLVHTLFFPKRKEDMKARYFEVIGCGGFLLTNNVPYLNKYFKLDEEIVCYKNINSLIEKIKFFLINEDKRDIIANNGYKRVLKEHTYKKRFESIFKNIQKK